MQVSSFATPLVTPELRPSTGRHPSTGRTRSGAPPQGASAPAPHHGRDVWTVLAEADRIAVALQHAVDRLALPIGRTARGFVDGRGWQDAGFARLEDFAVEAFQRSARWLRDMASLDRSVRRFPDLRRALTGDDGSPPLGAVKATAIGRFLASPPAPRDPAARSLRDAAAECALGDWIRFARSASVPELRNAIRDARRSGTLQPPPAGPGKGASEAAGTSLTLGRGNERTTVTPAGLSSDRRTPFARDGAAVAPGAAAAAGGSMECAARTETGRVSVRSPSSAAATGTGHRARTIDSPPIGYRHAAGVGDGPLPAREDAAGSDKSDDAAGDPAGDAPRRHVFRMNVPPAIRAAFEETLDLHRAVVGEATAPPGDLVEALVAETAASGMAPDEYPPPRVRPAPSPERERELARRRSTLPPPADCVREAALLLPELRQLAALERDPEPATSRGQVRRLEALIRLGEQLHRRLGQLLGELSVCGAWSHFGFRDLGHYAEARLGIAAATAERRARLARRLCVHPEVRAAYEEGRLGLESARLVLQAVGVGGTSPETVRAWVREAERVTVKRLRDGVGIRNRLPSAGDGPSAALPPDDAAWSDSLRRDPGRTRSRLRALGATALADPVAADALRLRLRPEEAMRLRGALRERRAALEEGVLADRHAGDEDLASARLAESFAAHGRGLPDWVALLAMLEDYADTWDDPSGLPRRAEDRTYSRDGWRCRAPACTARRKLEAHHIHYHSRGGDDAPENLVTLCRFHHQAGEHGGLLRVTGEAPLALHFEIGRFDQTRTYRNERRTGANTLPPRSQGPMNTGQRGSSLKVKSGIVDDPGR